MSKNQNLQEFFNKNKKKKPANQDKPQQASQSQLGDSMQEAKPYDVTNQTPPAKPQKKQDDYESDDEERTDLNLADNAIAIVNK